jgi:hypothetical protein
LGTPRGVPLLISWFLFLLAFPGPLRLLGTSGRPTSTAASVDAPTSSLFDHFCQYRLKDAPGLPAVVIVFGVILLPSWWSCESDGLRYHSLRNASSNSCLPIENAPRQTTHFFMQVLSLVHPWPTPYLTKFENSMTTLSE